jgi:hypothetical protein
MQQKPELWRTTDYGLVKDLHLVKQRIAALESTYLPVQKLVDRAENEALVVDWKNYCLYYSATNGSLEVCQHLILYEKANPTVKLKFRNGETATHAAARSGCSNVLKLFADDGWSLQLVDDAGRTPASWAYRNGCKGCQKILLQSKKHPRSVRSSNSTEEENDGNSSEGNNEKDCPARHGSSTDEIESGQHSDLTGSLERTLQMQISLNNELKEELRQERSDRADVEKRLKEQISALETRHTIQEDHLQELKKDLERKTLECNDLREQLKKQCDIYVQTEERKASLNSSRECSQEAKAVLDLEHLVAQSQSKVGEQSKSLLMKYRERRDLQLQIETLERELKDGWCMPEEATAILQCPVNTDHIRRIYRKICHRWREVARCFCSIKLLDYEIDQAYSSSPETKEQTYTMLATWIEKVNKRGENPTLYDLCCGLIDAELKDAAVDAFGQHVIDLVVNCRSATST